MKTVGVMNLTNKFKLPEAIVNAVNNDGYSKGGSDFSITELLKPSRIWALQRQNHTEIEEDVSDRLWSLYGQIAHTVLERANESDLVEKRYFVELDGRTVSSQIDSLSAKDGILTDYKFSTAWKFKAGKPPEDWVWQLNMQAYILGQNGIKVNKIQIVGLLRDYSKPESMRNPDYPQAPIVVMPIPRLSDEKVKEFIIERMKSHIDAIENLPLCSQEDRWAKPDKWAVIKKGAKRATKLFDDQKLAKDIADSTPGMTVELRPGMAVRCEMYCSASKFCLQYQGVLNERKEV